MAGSNSEALQGTPYAFLLRLKQSGRIVAKWAFQRAIER